MTIALEKCQYLMYWELGNVPENTHGNIINKPSSASPVLGEADEKVISFTKPKFI